MAADEGENARIDWSKAETDYVTGNETYSKLAQRLKVGRKAVEAHALDRSADGKTWGEKREAWRARTRERAEEQASEAIAARYGRIRSKAGEVAEKALDEMLARLSAGGTKTPIPVGGDVMDVVMPIAPRDLVMAAKLAVAIKVEVGGDPDGVPIDLARKLDSLDVDDLKRLAAGKT